LPHMACGKLHGSKVHDYFSARPRQFV
jgi:hypothetical protein